MTLGWAGLLLRQLWNSVSFSDARIAGCTFAAREMIC